MKNIITYLLVLFLIPNLSAQIIHTNYGDEFVVSLNADVPLDVNEDGEIDFYLNQKEGDLALTPIFLSSCIIGTGGYTSFFTQEIQLFNEGDFIQMGGSGGTSISLYIEDEPVSVFTTSVENGLANGWVDKADHYIGFALVGSGTSNGWIKLSVDLEAETLTIKEIAYKEPSSFFEGINAGQTVEITTAVSPLAEVLNEVAVNPNPAKDFARVTFSYSGNERLSVSVINSIGQEIQQINSNNLSSNFDLNTSDWAEGIYFVRFETKDGSYTKKISIVR